MAWDDMNDLFWLRTEPAGAAMLRGAQAGAAIAGAWTAGRAQKEQERSNKARLAEEIRSNKAREELAGREVDVRQSAENARYWNTVLDDDRSNKWLRFQQDQWNAKQTEEQNRLGAIESMATDLRGKLASAGATNPGQSATSIVGALADNPQWLMNPYTAPIAQKMMDAANTAINVQADAVKGGTEARVRSSFYEQLKGLPPHLSVKVLTAAKEYGDTDPKTWAALEEAGRLAAAEDKEKKNAPKPKLSFEEFAAQHVGRVRALLTTQPGKPPDQKTLVEQLRKDYEAVYGTKPDGTPASSANPWEAFQLWNKPPTK